MQKLVDTPHYHLWTDAVHGGALAHQARNKWDRGTYVRWTIITAWTVLEIACQDALEEPNISYSFRRNLDAAVAARSLSRLDWGKGIWQRVVKVQEQRKSYMHRFVSEKDLFPEAALADNAIGVVREAIQEIYTHAGKTPPKWVEDDEDRGWDTGRSASAHLTVTRKGVDPDDPNAIRVAYVYKGGEYIDEVLSPGTDPIPYMENLIRRIRVPISAVRAYRGTQLIEERQLPMRGT